MNTQNDGGPAFPEPMAYHPQRERMSFCQEEGGAPGMTLRDWFAGQALSGMLQREHAYAFLDDDPTSGHTVKAATNNHARAAYNVADAMLAARKKDL